MAKKTLGYVELEWKCPTCGTRNPGSRRVCQNCGSPQPDDVQFEAPAQGEIRTDQETVQQATAGPDIHCPYCGARNPAGAKVCKQCGGDLSGAAARQAGQIVQGFGAKRPDVQCPACGTMNPAGRTVCNNCGAPLPAPTPVAPPNAAKQPASRGCLWIGAGLAVLALITVAFLIFSGGRTTATTGEVVDARWTRTIDVQGLVPVRYTGWLDQIPGDAVLGACTEEVREVVEEPAPGAREVCGTPYAVDQGSGFAEVVVDCVYEIVEQRCEYTVNEWRVVDQIVEEGSGFSPQWPALRLSGRQREGDRGERYQCIFTAGGKTYVYDVRDAGQYARCTVGSLWSLQVNDAGRVIAAEPVE
ncbi:MAG TPA: zinc ribbon domain-containing protein [Caldilineaceae bacterium]|nr:zinc ribbon domain-containing protein [Caldilineaceae bacterium]